jgi:hypothetical protein
MLLQGCDLSPTFLLPSAAAGLLLQQQIDRGAHEGATTAMH